MYDKLKEGKIVIDKKREKQKLNIEYDILHKRLDSLYKKLYGCDQKCRKRVQEEIDKLKERMLELNKKSIQILL